LREFPDPRNHAAKKLYERLADLHKKEHEARVREAVERGLVSVL